MWSLPVVALHQIPTDIPLCQCSAHVAQARHPFRLQAAKQPLHWRVVMAVPAPAHALLEPIAPQSLTEAPAPILAALIALKQPVLWAATLFIGHIQRLDHQVGIGLRRKCPAHYATGKKIDHSCHVVPATLCPDIRDISATDFIRCRHVERPLQYVRDIRPLHRSLFVGMRTGLLADQLHLAHQLAHLEPPNFDPVVTHHEHDASAARRTAALSKKLVHTATQKQLLNVWGSAFTAVRVVTGTGDFKDRAQQINRLFCTKLINQRKRSCSPAIRSAVAFFRIDFSRSSRLIRASNSWIFCCSGVSALLAVVMPFRSSWS